MNVGQYAEFLARIGHHIIASTSGYWYDAGPRMYERIPAYSLAQPSESESRHLFWRQHVLGFKYYAPPVEHLGKTSFLYICEDPEYELGSLGRSTRRKVRTGLRNCEVREIGFGRLIVQGLALNRDTLARQKRFDPLLGDPARWQTFCQAAGQTEGVLAWGALAEGRLLAYTIGFHVQEWGIFLYQNSATEQRQLFVNHALTHIATKEMLARPGVRHVSQGHETIRGLSGLDEFKVRLGYAKKPLRQIFRFHPLAQPLLLNPASRWALRKLGQMRPESDALRCANGILEIAKASRDRMPRTSRAWHTSEG